ncbi:MAG: YesL family protein [Atopobiaceae bacterium]|nr:YesL family protein [Atopobiaceae bacterium]MCH4180579.1 YesL family protein [Atopobiaceae bacterium]MCH4214304.1 YesL family protein [Atopobiaceae bacterium]MCH4230438.1 YesL family protein [Atopobiaceae bacterium]MCH4276129.1 YesL family protein [Atopobiaceae bacterium]
MAQMNLKVDSPLIQAGIKVTNLLILNIYWILGCLPLITIGTSTIAAFTVCEKMAEDREGIGMTREFWGAYKENLRNGIPLTLVFAAGAYAVWFNFQLFNKLPDNPIWFLIFAILMVVLMVVHGLYAFALEARYANTLRGSLVNARLIFFRFFPRTLALAGILFIQWLLFFQTSTVLVYVGVFCAPILMIYTASQISMPIFRKLEHNSYANESLSVSGDN